MFIKFSCDKTRYDKGQVFPYLIAVMAVVLIMILITINLGQLGSFKTEVSNAADAGALAGASVLSGGLLGFGLKSDAQFGEGFVVGILGLVFIILGIVEAIGSLGISTRFLQVGAAIFLTYYVRAFFETIRINGEGVINWKNAKLTALQYAFNNVNVDEPRPSFEQFVMDVKGVYARAHPPIIYNNIEDINAADLKYLYDVYLKGDDSGLPLFPNEARKVINDKTKSGFARFMEDNMSGYWNIFSFGQISPWPFNDMAWVLLIVELAHAFQIGEISGDMVGKILKDVYEAFKRGFPTAEVVSGYGWQNDNGIISNSYCDSQGNKYNDIARYLKFKNYVEVAVRGTLPYLVLPGNIFRQLISDIVGWITATAINIILFFVPEIIRGIIRRSIVKAVEYWVNILLIGSSLLFSFPTHWTFGLGTSQEMDDYTTGNPIYVTVARYKADNNLGLWRLRYGRVSATAKAHAYRETGIETINQVVLPSPGDIIRGVINYVGFHYNDFKEDPSSGAQNVILYILGALMPFNTDKHLFETELMH
jgi:hypothetical protein